MGTDKLALVRPLLLQFGVIEFRPVVEIVEINSIAGSLFIIREARGRNDGATRLIVMIESADGRIKLRDRFFVDLGARLFADPLLELAISWTLLGDKRNNRIAIEIQTIEDHLIETLADGWVAGCEFSTSVKGDLEPKPREMQNTEWTGNAGTKEGNNI
jgi:hypothetical protein